MYVSVLKLIQACTYMQTMQLVSFSFCNGLRVTNIRLKDSADKHMSVFECSQVQVHNVTVVAPRDSPNTDGITMGASDHVRISSCNIHSGTAPTSFSSP